MFRKKWILAGLALILLLALALVVAGAPTAVALRLAGFRAEGITDDYLANAAARPAIVWQALAGTPTPVGTPSGAGEEYSTGDVLSSVQDAPQTLDSVTVDVWFLDQPYVFYPQEIFTKQLERGVNENGDLAYYIAFNQEGINTYLNYWFSDAIQSEARIKDAWLDLRPGGAVLYADVDLEVGWQRAGAVFMLDSSGTQLILAGVDIAGQLYSTPPEGRIADLAGQLEIEVNKALSSLTFIDTAGELTIQTIQISDDEVQVLAY